MPIRTILIYLMLAGNTVFQAQQPDGWRPNITEDNKAASWEDTAAFIVGALANDRGRPHELSRCVLALPSELPAQQSDPFGMKLKNIETGRGAEIVAINPGSFAEQVGLTPGSVINEVNRERVHTASDVAAIWAKTHDSEDIVFAISKGKGAFTSSKLIGGTLGSPSATPANVEVHLLVSRIDPLGIVVRGREIQVSGTNTETVVEWLVAHPSSSDRKFAVIAADDEVARRVARALMHAALLCGGTKAVSPF